VNVQAVGSVGAHRLHHAGGHWGSRAGKSGHAAAIGVPLPPRDRPRLMRAQPTCGWTPRPSVCLSCTWRQTTFGAVRFGTGGREASVASQFAGAGNAKGWRVLPVGSEQRSAVVHAVLWRCRHPSISSRGLAQGRTRQQKAAPPNKTSLTNWPRVFCGSSRSACIRNHGCPSHEATCNHFPELEWCRVCPRRDATGPAGVAEEASQHCYRACCCTVSCL
jgi:hypothetical protein